MQSNLSFNLIEGGVRVQWTKTLPNGRRITYTYEQLEGDGAILGAYVEGDNVDIGSVSNIPLTQEQVEAWFQEYASQPRN